MNRTRSNARLTTTTDRSIDKWELQSSSVCSADRTTIAFDRYGDGRPVIVIGGAYNDRSTAAGVAEAISSALVREGRRDDAVVLFSTEAVGLPTAIVEGMRAAPGWGWLTALAHTLPYDLAIHHGYRLPTERLAELVLPLLALDGSESFPWIRATARALAHAVSRARHLTLEGQDHSVLRQPHALRPALVEFFS